MRKFLGTIKQKFNNHELFPDALDALKAFLLWLVLGGAVGLIVGLAASALGHILALAADVRAKYPFILLGLPLGGLLIVLLYRVLKDANDRGTNAVVASLHSSTEIPFRAAPLIFVSTCITHFFGGSAGREGAAIQLGGSIANKIGRTLKLKKNDRHTIVMCGMSAGFSALFGTPMAAAVFSLEFARVGAMHYSALLPCVVASFAGHLVAQLVKLPPESFHVAALPEFSIPIFFRIMLFAAIAAAVSVLLCVVLHRTEHLLAKYLKNVYVRIAATGCVIVALSFIPGWDAYLGTGMGLIEGIFHDGAHSSWYAFLLKILFTSLTIGAGYKGGEIVPTLAVGALLGCAVAPLLGLPDAVVTACGMVALFCGVTNCPITSLLLAFELFGFEGMPYYLTAVAVSFMLSGYHSLYREQRFAFSKTETEE